MVESEVLFKSIQQSFWRLMALKWAHDPISGAGAAAQGGRFNRKGQHTLYMSSDLETALAEFGQDMADRPGTFCRYDVIIDHIVDVRDRDGCAAFGVTPSLMACPWKKILLLEKTDPPTWSVVDTLLNIGASGALVPSLRRPAGYNLVLWKWDGNKVKPFDPNNDLPMSSKSITPTNP